MSALPPPHGRVATSTVPPLSRPFRRSVTNYDLMSDWIHAPPITQHDDRTCSFPDAFTETDWRAVRTGSFRGYRPTEGDYYGKYQNLMQHMTYNYQCPNSPRHKQGGKGGWRYIRESYGAGINVLAWLDGSVPSSVTKSYKDELAEYAAAYRGRVLPPLTLQYGKRESSSLSKDAAKKSKRLRPIPPWVSV